MPIFVEHHRRRRRFDFGSSGIFNLSTSCWLHFSWTNTVDFVWIALLPPSTILCDDGDAGSGSGAHNSVVVVAFDVVGTGAGATIRFNRLNRNLCTKSTKSVITHFASRMFTSPSTRRKYIHSINNSQWRRYLTMAQMANMNAMCATIGMHRWARVACDANALAADSKQWRNSW